MTDNKISSQRITSGSVAKHPSDAIRHTLDQIPQKWESTDQIAAVKRVVRLAIPPPRPFDIRRAATILFASGVIDRPCYRWVWRYISSTNDQFGTCPVPGETRYPKFYTLQHLYHEGRGHDGQGKEAVRLVTRLAARLPSRRQFSGGMYYRHFLSLRSAACMYWHRANGQQQ